MADNDAEARYNEFVKFLYQYLANPVQDYAAVKPQILQLFKTHRPIKVIDYQYGFSKTAKKKGQLIVHEFNDDRSKVREYFKSGKNTWHCCECVRTGADSSNNEMNDLVISHGIIFVKLEHHCAPRELSFVMDIQECYKEKDLGEALALQKSVLGSEDLNKVFYRKTFAFGKYGSNIYHPTYANEGNSDTSMPHVNEENKNGEGFQPLNMDKQLADSRNSQTPEAAFKEFFQHLEEYSTQKKDVILQIKTKLLNVLRTHRPVKIGEYQYGLSETLRQKERIIVFEWDDKNRVREYSKRTEKDNLWDCRQCLCGWHEKRPLKSTYLYLINDIVFVPTQHDCESRTYKSVMQVQKCLEQGDVTKAKAIAHKRTRLLNDNKIFGNAPASSSKEIADTGKEMNNDENNPMIAKNLKRNLQSNNFNDESAANKKPKSANNGDKKSNDGDILDNIFASLCY